METIVSENWSNKSEHKDRKLIGEFGKLDKVVNDHYFDSSAVFRNDVSETD